MKSSIRILSFDLVGTLIHPEYVDSFWEEEIPKQLARERGISFEKAREYALAEYQKIGDNDVRWYLPAFWTKKFGLLTSPITILETSANKTCYYPDTLEALASLHDRYQMIIASGAPIEIIEFVIRPIASYFHRIFSTVSSLGYVKKTEDFYSHICRELGSKCESILHIGDDKILDFELSRRAGFNSYYLDRKCDDPLGYDTIRNLVELRNKLL